MIGLIINLIKSRNCNSNMIDYISNLCFMFVLSLALLQVLLIQVHANPSSSTTQISGANEVIRLKEASSASSNPFERVILDYMEKSGLVDDSKRHVKYLLNEQESFDFSTKLSAADILHRSKFEYEIVNVTSKDGYITQLIRIINPLVELRNRKSPPVVLYAGQGVSVNVFLIASLGSHSPSRWPLDNDFPNKLNANKRSLAITLANNGYDVWLVGTRGTDEANCGRVGSTLRKAEGIRNSVAPVALIPRTPAEEAAAAANHSLKFSSSSLSINVVDNSKTQQQQQQQQLQESTNYWSFSHDEIIHYEFKAQMDSILTKCKSSSEKFSLITYSNGAFIAYAFASAYPEYSSKHIDTMINLAPAVYINKWNSVLGKTGLLAASGAQNFPLIAQKLDSFARGLWFKMCNSRVLRYTICKTALNLLYGFSDNYQTHLELKLLDYIGKPMSFAGFKQTLQCSYTSRLQHFDYGPIGNLMKYKQLVAPIYDLKQVNLQRVFILTGELDSIVDSQSVNNLISDCQRPPVKHLIIPGYNHLDIIAGWDVDYRINTPVLNILDDRCTQLSASNQINADKVERVHSLVGNQQDSVVKSTQSPAAITEAPLFRPPSSITLPIPIDLAPVAAAAAAAVPKTKTTTKTTTTTTTRPPAVPSTSSPAAKKINQFQDKKSPFDLTASSSKSELENKQNNDRVESDQSQEQLEGQIGEYQQKQEQEQEHHKEQQHEQDEGQVVEDYQRQHQEYKQEHQEEHEHEEGQSTEDHDRQLQQQQSEVEGERETEAEAEREVAVAVDGKHDEGGGRGQYEQVNRGESIVGSGESGEQQQVNYEQQGGETEPEPETESEREREGESEGQVGQVGGESEVFQGEEIVDLQGPSGTLGWSDKELGLSARRGLARIPQGVAGRQLFAPLTSTNKRPSNSARSGFAPKQQQQQRQQQQIKASLVL